MELQNKIALITGSSDRVGRTIALTLAAKGAHIAIHYYTNKEKALQTQKEVENLSGESLTLQGNISRKNDWIEMRDQRPKEFASAVEFDKKMRMHNPKIKNFADFQAQKK